MSDPIATPSDLAVFLQDDSIATDDDSIATATLLIQLASDNCSAIVSPLPATAKGIVLGIVARAFLNPTGIASQITGPETVTYGTASPSTFVPWPSEVKALKRLAGRAGAFSIDTLPTGTSAVQSVTITGSPTGGTFTLSLYGATTAPLAATPAASDISTALQSLGIIGAGNVSVSGDGPFTVSFINDLATTPVQTMTADATGLTGGTSPSVLVSVVTTGIFAPGQNLPGWDRDYWTNRTRILGLT